MAGTVKAIERKYMAHYIETSSLSSSTKTYSEGAKWYRLGEDLEEFSIELNPDTESKKNILGETSFKHKGYDASASSDPFYCKQNDEMFEAMQKIVDDRAAGDDCKTYALEVHLWETASSGSYTAYAQPCFVVPTSYGGDTSGYQIPFNITYVGERIKGTATVEDGVVTFTKAS